MSRFIPCLVFAAALPSFGQGVNLSGIVTDSAGTPVSGADLKLEGLGLTTTSGADGRFTLGGSTGIRAPGAQGSAATASAGIRSWALSLSLPAAVEVSVTVRTLAGAEVAAYRRELSAGSYSLPLAGLGTGLRFIRVEAGGFQAVLKAHALDGVLHGSGAAATGSVAEVRALAALAKPAAAAALYDVLTSTKSGFQKAYVSVSRPDSADIQIRMLKETSPKFSFFVTSMRGLQELAKNDSGFGGDYRFGETGPGAGLRGADKICATLAEKSMKGSGVKGWRAFLSVTADAKGAQVNAIDRVGPGPWYDRAGRLLAPTKADLVAVRPKNGDPTVAADLPNENGIGNHRPDPNGAQEDNHHTMTGSDANGRLKSATATCKDWTTAVHSSENGKPSGGFSWPRGGAGSTGSGANWMTTWDSPGCARGIEITNGGGPSQTANQRGWIGGGGGYGGFYCFALNP